MQTKEVKRHTFRISFTIDIDGENSNWAALREASLHHVPIRSRNVKIETVGIGRALVPVEEEEIIHAAPPSPEADQSVRPVALDIEPAAIEPAPAAGSREPADHDIPF